MLVAASCEPGIRDSLGLGASLCALDNTAGRLEAGPRFAGTWGAFAPGMPSDGASMGCTRNGMPPRPASPPERRGAARTVDALPETEDELLDGFALDEPPGDVEIVPADAPRVADKGAPTGRVACAGGLAGRLGGAGSREALVPALARIEPRAEVARSTGVGMAAGLCVVAAVVVVGVVVVVSGAQVTWPIHYMLCRDSGLEINTRVHVTAAAPAGFQPGGRNLVLAGQFHNTTCDHSLDGGTAVVAATHWALGSCLLVPSHLGLPCVERCPCIRHLTPPSMEDSGHIATCTTCISTVLSLSHRSVGRSECKVGTTAFPPLRCGPRPICGQSRAARFISQRPQGQGR